MTKYDVIIIGAGVYGLELASYFKNKKKHVLILEKEATAVSRSSYAIFTEFSLYQLRAVEFLPTRV